MQRHAPSLPVLTAGCRVAWAPSYMEQIKSSGNTRMIDLKNMNEVPSFPLPWSRG